MSLNHNAIKAILQVIDAKTDYTSESTFTHKEYFTNGTLLKYVKEFDTTLSTKDIKIAIEILIQTNLVNLVEVPLYMPNGDLKMVKIHSLSADGHEFLDSIKNESVWKVITGFIKEHGTMSLKSMISLAGKLSVLYVTDQSTFNEYVHNAKMLWQMIREFLG